MRAAPSIAPLKDSPRPALSISQQSLAAIRLSYQYDHAMGAPQPYVHTVIIWTPPLFICP
jgi:hypothetical protein